MEKFMPHKIINYDDETKSIIILGHIDESDAIVILRKKAYDKELKQLNYNNIKQVFHNDIYKKFVGQQLSEEDIELIYPATQNHIDKYTKSQLFIEYESYQDYLKKPNDMSIQWLYNIIDGLKEQENILYQNDLFLIIKDYKFLSNDNETIHLVAAFKDKKIKSLRELEQHHIPLLSEIRNQGLKIINELYQIDAKFIRVFVHYPPTFYQFHVHFQHISIKGTAYRDQDLNTVIQNLELNTNYYRLLNIACEQKNAFKVLRQFLYDAIYTKVFPFIKSSFLYLECDQDAFIFTCDSMEIITLYVPDYDGVEYFRVHQLSQELQQLIHHESPEFIILYKLVVQNAQKLCSYTFKPKDYTNILQEMIRSALLENLIKHASQYLYVLDAVTQSLADSIQIYKAFHYHGKIVTQFKCTPVYQRAVKQFMSHAKKTCFEFLIQRTTLDKLKKGIRILVKIMTKYNHQKMKRKYLDLVDTLCLHHKIETRSAEYNPKVAQSILCHKYYRTEFHFQEYDELKALTMFEFGMLFERMVHRGALEAIISVSDKMCEPILLLQYLKTKILSSKYLQKRKIKMQSKQLAEASIVDVRNRRLKERKIK
ncbi:hypothetical protein pb186bvf_017668 [Paramecium bursaria]